MSAEHTAVRLRPDGALDRDPRGHPVRLITSLDGAAFNAHWLDTITALTTAPPGGADGGPTEPVDLWPYGTLR